MFEKERRFLMLRYFIINNTTNIMHIQGYCCQTKPRSIPIRLYEDPAELEKYAARKLRLCKTCQQELDKQSK